MALLFIGNRGALCYKEKKMSDKEGVEEEKDKERESKEMRVSEALRVQLEFEFDEDLVSPI